MSIHTHHHDNSTGMQGGIPREDPHVVLDLRGVEEQLLVVNVVGEVAVLYSTMD